jgi:superfamily II DNA or RNA helicase
MTRVPIGSGCHHVPAASYQAVVPWLRPELFVGLTATPERSDGKSLLPDFDNHIAAELRLWHALDGQLLLPFEYYGVSDGVDLRKVRWSRTGYDAGGLVHHFVTVQNRYTLEQWSRMIEEAGLVIARLRGCASRGRARQRSRHGPS